MNTHPDNFSVRVFFSLWPKASERDAFAEWQTTLQPLCNGRLMRPDTLHATLVFLGEVATGRLAALMLAAEEVRAARFDFRVDAARYWGHNHILYAAPSNIPAPLLHLVSELERHLIRHHFKFEPREYKPHVTLMRNVHWNDEPLPEVLPVSWSIQEFVLVQSASQNSEANYRILAKFLLL
jgi:2'-5' RNA ligase